MSIITAQQNQAPFGESISHSQDGRFLLVGQPNALVNNSGSVFLYERINEDYTLSHTFQPEEEDMEK